MPYKPTKFLTLSDVTNINLFGLRLLTVFTAIQSFSRNVREWKTTPLTLLHCPYSRNRKASWHRGRAERKPTLSLELERGLFKLRADGPELDVLLKLDPRIGSHLYKCDCFPMYFLFLLLPAVYPLHITANHTTDFVYLFNPHFPCMEVQTRLLFWV